MSFSVLVSLLPYWIYVNIGIYSVLDYINFWNFWKNSQDISEILPDYSVILMFLSVCLSISYISSDWSFLGGQLLRPLVLLLMYEFSCHKYLFSFHCFCVNVFHISWEAIFLIFSGIVCNFVLSFDFISFELPFGVIINLNPIFYLYSCPCYQFHHNLI